MKLWAGRFKDGLSPAVHDFNASIRTDYTLLPYDLQASLAHGQMLMDQGIVSKEDGQAIIQGLTQMAKELQAGQLEIDWSAEDVHTFIEGQLTARIGDAGKRLHTGRSRNDQVAVATKLYTVDMCTRLINGVNALIEVLVALAEKHKSTILPGYTHLQRAQPITLGHHLLAYGWMLLRDRQRLLNCQELTQSQCPLGSGALAGTTYPIDRHWCAKALGFTGPSQNSLDGVSDRDFALELLHCSSLIMLHLSRFSEEIILWASWEFQFIRLDDAFSTGSSIMPQKKNPDIAELVRGKSGRVFGDLMSLLTTMKGLPLAYNKDMQEDKEALFDGVETALACLDMFGPMLSSMEVLPENMLKAARKGFINATDCADYLVGKGLAFRDAYKITGGMVAHCIKEDTTLEELTLSQFKAYSPLFQEDIYTAIDLVTCVDKRTSYGAPADIDRQLEEIKEKLRKNQGGEA